WKARLWRVHVAGRKVHPVHAIPGRPGPGRQLSDHDGAISTQGRPDRGGEERRPPEPISRRERRAVPGPGPGLGTSLDAGRGAEITPGGGNPMKRVLWILAIAS